MKVTKNEKNTGCIHGSKRNGNNDLEMKLSGQNKMECVKPESKEKDSG